MMNTILAAASAANTDVGYGRYISIGLLLVMVIIAVVSLRRPSSGENAARAEAASPVPVPVPVPQAAAGETDGLTDEVVAAIAAAVASMAPEGVRYTVKSIRPAGGVPRVRAGRSAWGLAGLAESTRPF